jgi:two-component system response regulator YesN
MYKVMIVDDEHFVVDSLTGTLPWSELGIGEVFGAYSAREALQIIEQHHIDIVLTDIRMPGMDGIQLIERIRSLSSNTECVLLTGYEDFSYAKEAIRHQVADYLLKPVSDDTIIAAIRSIIGKLNDKWEQISSYQRAVSTLNEQLPALQADLLRDLLDGRKFGAKQLEDKLRVLRLPFGSNDTVALMLIRLEGEFASEDYKDRWLIEYAVINMAREIMAHDFHLWSCRDAHDYLVVAVAPRAAEGARHEMAKQNGHAELLDRLERGACLLQENVATFLKGNVSVVVGGQREFPAGLPKLHAEVLALIRTQIGSNQGFFMTARSVPERGSIDALSALHKSPSLLHLFEAGYWEEIRLKLDGVFTELERLGGRGQATHEYAVEVYHAVSAALYHYAHSNGRSIAELLKDVKLYLPEDSLSVQRLREWATAVCDALYQTATKEMSSSRSAVVHIVEDYILSRLSEDVSLQTLADHVGWHPVHLSKVFKLETGEMLSDYLLRIRMERAVQLLKGSELKIFEIAAEVGYLTTSYFIKVFKKYYGITPQEYRTAGEG